MNVARCTLLGLVLALAGAAQAQFTFKTEVEAVEVAPANIILPATASGMVSFKPCDGDCAEPYVRIQLSPNTRFSLDGQSLKFDDFRREFSIVRRSRSSYALINYDVKTNTATNIEVLR